MACWFCMGKRPAKGTDTMCLQCRGRMDSAAHNGRVARRRKSVWDGCDGPVVTWKGVVVMQVDGGTRRVKVDPAKLPATVRTIRGTRVTPINLNEWQEGMTRERVKHYQSIIRSFL